MCKTHILFTICNFFIFGGLCISKLVTSELTFELTATLEDEASPHSGDHLNFFLVF